MFVGEQATKFMMWKNEEYPFKTLNTAIKVYICTIEKRTNNSNLRILSILDLVLVKQVPQGKRPGS